MAPVSEQTDLALRTLRALSGVATAANVAPLAATLGTTPDQLLEVLAPLTYAGWVARDAADPDAFRFTRPVPPPTVHEVIDAVDGAGAIDDCVLRPVVGCAALASAPVCGGHLVWQRQLNGSALVVVPLAAALRAPVRHDANVVRLGRGRRESATSAPGAVSAPAAAAAAPAASTAPTAIRMDDGPGDAPRQGGEPPVPASDPPAAVASATRGVAP